MAITYIISCFLILASLARLYGRTSVRPYVTRNIVTMLLIMAVVPILNVFIVITSIFTNIVKYQKLKNMSSEERRQFIIQNLIKIDTILSQIFSK